jgi:hypothetical protein
MNQFLDEFNSFINLYDEMLILKRVGKKDAFDSWRKSIDGLKYYKKKCIYIMGKYVNQKPMSFYIGKSKNGVVRVQNHIRLFYNNSKNKNLDSVSKDWYDNWFNDIDDFEIKIFFFDWEKSRSVFSDKLMGIKVNFYNAEPLIIGLASKAGLRLVNKQFNYISNIDSFEKNKDNFEKINIYGKSVKDIWKKFLSWVIQEDVNLFEYDEQLIVKTKMDNKGRRIFLRSQGMNELIIEKVWKVHDSYYDENEISADGLIYLMYKKQRGIVIPLYIGSTQTVGRSGNYSANLKGVHNGRNLKAFARWGDDSSRHIGGLSYSFFNYRDQNSNNQKHEGWIKSLFTKENYDMGVPQLKNQIFFAIREWYPFNRINGFENIPISFMEAIFISIASDLYPDYLINKYRS